MKNNKISTFISFACQVSIAVIFGYAVFSKFRGDDIGFFIFESLGIPESRLIIAGLEAAAVVLLFVPSWIQHGALLSFTIMLGALFAHVGVLGWSVYEDGGELSLLMIAVLVCSGIIMYIRRKDLPFIGHTL